MPARIILIFLYVVLWFSVSKPCEVFVRVEEGRTAAQLAAHLRDSGVLLRKNIFLKLTALLNVDRELKYGAYKFYSSEPMFNVVSELKKGRGLLMKVTVPEGWRSAQIAERLDANEIIGMDEFLEYTEKNKLEGFLFPETYYFSPGMSAEEICSVFRKQFNSVFTPALAENAKECGLTLYKAVILASIIEKEAKTISEKFLISGILHNRLRKRWRLESCATVRFALEKWNKPLSIEDTFVKSKYNTYRHRGLPPAPICNPGAVALAAAVTPEETEMMFFVAASSGTHRFSKYFDQHVKKKFKRKKGNGF